ncbi:MAG: hypothetical protein HY721_16095 [Planctomycetes bacterium]|nr:hypothetical protein [Planctomycetota bacterium]
MKPIASYCATALLFVLVLGITVARPEEEGSHTKAGKKKEPTAELNGAALMALLRSRVPLVLLDARGKADQVIRGAKLIAAEPTSGEVAAAVDEKGALVVVYCTDTRCPLRRKLSDRLRSLGYSNVIEYPDGIAGWVRAGYPVQDIPRQPATSPKGKGSPRKPEGSGRR